MMKKTPRLLFILVLIMSSLHGGSSVYALDENSYIQNDILYYSKNSVVCSGQSGGATVALIGNDNTEKILRYFVDKGLTLEQSSGIAGNLWQESRHTPNTIQGGAIAESSYKMVGDVGFGLAQWSDAGRQAGLQALADTKHLPITDMLLQLDYLWSEMSPGGSREGALAPLKATTTPEDAAYVFHKDFEGSADTPSEVKENRAKRAKEFFDEYSKIIASGSSTSGSCSGSGTPSKYIDGFAVYNQNDPQWSDKGYGTSTIGGAGCGPSAMAAIITALTGSVVTPVDTATYGAANGTWTDGSGSNWTIADVLSKHWNLKSHPIQNIVATINSSLRAGSLILVSGEGSVPFTTSGHFIVIRAVTADNKWLIADSNGSGGLDRSSQAWDPQVIISAGAKGFWEVTK